MRERGYQRAAELLETISFALYDATNDFEDEFAVLHVHSALSDYVRLEVVKKERDAFGQIARTIKELGIFVRLIVAEPLTSLEESPTVSPPKPAMTSGLVERALADAETLLKTTDATSALDRAHTALHGYVRATAEKLGKEVADDANLTTLFKVIKQEHPAFQQTPHSVEAARVVNGFASILDAFNTARNRGSVAHPNEELLPEAEAMLMINASRTILHYLDAKLGVSSPA